MSPLLLVLPAVWLLAATFVVLLCRGAARADEQLRAALEPLHGHEGRAHPPGARITRPAPGAHERSAGASTPAVLVHTAQARARLRARLAADARTRGPRCPQRS